MSVDAVTICGTDLHILKGDVPEVQPGTILGHEAVGTVLERGDAVTTVDVGDRVLASCITSCGRCAQCRIGRYGLCEGGGGWILGHLIDGVQAEYARIPFADTSVHKIPATLTDEQVLFLADILPTSYEVGVLAGRGQAGGYGRDRRRRSDRSRRRPDRGPVHAPRGDRRRSRSLSARSRPRLRCDRGGRRVRRRGAPARARADRR